MQLDQRMSVYQPGQQGLKFPAPPVFSRVTPVSA